MFCKIKKTGLMSFNLLKKTFSIDWSRPFASAYFRSAGSYLSVKFVIFTLAGLISQFMLIHYLAKEDYGLLVWVGTIIALLSCFGLPGISTSITVAVAKGFDANFRRGTWLEIAGGTVGGLILLGFAGYYWFWSHEETKALLFVLAGVLGPGLWLDTHQCYWTGKKKFKALFLWAVPVRLLQLIATATVLLCFNSSPLWIFGVQTVILVIANIGAAIGIIMFGGINTERSKGCQGFGWFSTKLYLIGTFVSHLDKLIIGLFFGLDSLAVFAVGELLYTYLYKLPFSFLSQIFLPRIAEMEIKQAARWIRRRQFYLVAGIVLVVIAVGIAIPIVFPLMFSVKYKDSIFYAYLFLLCIVLGSPTLLCGSLLKAHAMKKETMVGWSILCFTPMVFIPLFGWFFGIKGIVLTRGLTNGAISGYYFWLTNRLIKKN